jgi:hypothetical protein
VPLVDVTDNLFDDLISGQTFTVTEFTVGSDGQGTRVDVPKVVPGVVGSVQPASGRDLLRTPDLERVAGAITVKTTYRLKNGWLIQTRDGQTYTVRGVRDWTEFGAGFVDATCELRDLTEAT